MAAATDKTFLALPPPPTTYDDDPRGNISVEEQKMYNEVLAHFTKTDPVYTIPHVEKGAELMDEEKFWLSRDCLLRYLRASKWKVNVAIQRLEATLKWRREFGMYDKLNADLVEPEAVTGKEILFGYDKLGKPAFYMIPSRQNTTEARRQIQFAVWMLERGVDLMESGVENLALLINFGDRGKNPSISTALAVLHILQNHYPERLGLALIINVPFFVNAFFKVVMPLVDPITRHKVKFNPEIFKDGLFTTDNVMKEWDGDHHFEYDHDKYWPDLVALCQSRTKTWEKNWRELGALVGISEWAYKTYTASDASTVDEKAELVVSKGPEISDDPPKIDMPEPVHALSLPGTASEIEAEPRTAAEANGHAPQDNASASTAYSQPSVAGATAAGAVTGSADDATDSAEYSLAF